MKSLYAKDSSPESRSKRFKALRAPELQSGVARGNDGAKTDYNGMRDKDKTRIPEQAKKISDIVSNIL